MNDSAFKAYRVQRLRPKYLGETWVIVTATTYHHSRYRIERFILTHHPSANMQVNHLMTTVQDVPDSTLFGITALLDEACALGRTDLEHLLEARKNELNDSNYNIGFDLLEMPNPLVTFCTRATFKSQLYEIAESTKCPALAETLKIYKDASISWHA